MLESFRAFDTEKTGFINVCQLKSILCEGSERLSEEEIEELLQILNPDSDGRINYEYSVNTGDDYFIITSNTTYVRTTKEDNVENSQCSFLFEYNDTDIKFIIFDIEKFPLNLKEEEYIENKVNDTNKKENDKIKQSEIKKFEFFLNSFYLPSFNLCLNTFYSNIYIIESLKVKYDRALVKIIESYYSL
ncbi:hypothetical protein CWI36_1863p0010 [Hamiltosporidium magnivora]|uniref:EF-hand domain-containing protein n=1 Tax=Hamiltosporidium magnivora TaxID=148818 RepID=A0A4Q9KYI8_9MICR|nr:hypothetical protein CWI36_1863p0010 [Hamiltosporidium magnivora]